ncbi:MAG: SRPBCC family protein [Actinomycetota bacterium]
MRPTPDAIASHEASIEIGASAEAIYDMVSDITRMGEWSPEAVGGRWLDGATGAEGDWFVGENETPDRSWERECQVAAAEPGRDFTFVVGGVEANCTWWSYEMDAIDGGATRLTERWWMVNKTPAMAAASQEQFDGRVAYTEEMLHTTLAAIKAAAEA